MPDLNDIINRWCDSIGLFDDNRRDELTDHISCEVHRQQQRGLARSEAIDKALEGLGCTEQLAAEFRKTEEENTMSETVGLGHVALFSRQLATLLSAGVPLVDSCDLAAKGADNPAMRRTILEVRDALSRDNSLADAMREHPDEFDTFLCDLIDRGEEAGKLEPMLEHVATFTGKTSTIEQKLRSCMRYCLLMSGLLCAVIVGMVKPLAGIAILVISFGLVFGVSWLMSRSEHFRDQVERLFLALPVIGDVVRSACLARFTRALSTTFFAGAPLAPSLAAAARMTDNVAYREAADSISSSMKMGNSLEDSMRETTAFPDLVLQMVRIGEQAGTLDVMFDRMAIYFEERTENALNGLASLVQPTLIAMLCGLVVFNSLPG